MAALGQVALHSTSFGLPRAGRPRAERSPRLWTLEAPGCEPRLAQSRSSTRENPRYTLVDAHLRLTRHVTYGSGVPGAYFLESHWAPPAPRPFPASQGGESNSSRRRLRV